jgi:hypothetical protein
MITHQIPRSRFGSTLDLSHISRTRRPSSLASGPGSAAAVSAGPPGGVVVGDADMDMDMGGGGTTSIDRPRQPAFCRFTGTGVGGGGGLGAWARTLAVKTAS